MSPVVATQPLSWTYLQYEEGRRSSVRAIHDDKKMFLLRCCNPEHQLVSPEDLVSDDGIFSCDDVVDVRGEPL